MAEQIANPWPDILWYCSVFIIVVLITNIFVVPWLRSVWPWYDKWFR